MKVHRASAVGTAHRDGDVLAGGLHGRLIPLAEPPPATSRNPDYGKPRADDHASRRRCKPNAPDMLKFGGDLSARKASADQRNRAVRQLLRVATLGAMQLGEARLPGNDCRNDWVLERTALPSHRGLA